jgi:hypothetical protein
MPPKIISLEDYLDIVSKAFERAGRDASCVNAEDVLASVMSTVECEITVLHEACLDSLVNNSTLVETLNLKKDASTEVDLALFSSLPSSSLSPTSFTGSAEEGNSSFSFFKFFSILSLFTGSAYLIYLVGSCFLVPVPPIEDIIAAVNFFSSPVIPQVTPVVPEVIIPEPSSTIVDYLPSYTTVIITTAVVVTLWFFGVPVPFM